MSRLLTVCVSQTCRDWTTGRQCTHCRCTQAAIKEMYCMQHLEKLVVEMVNTKKILLWKFHLELLGNKKMHLTFFIGYTFYCVIILCLFSFPFCVIIQSLLVHSKNWNEIRCKSAFIHYKLRSLPYVGVVCVCVCNWVFCSIMGISKAIFRVLALLWQRASAVPSEIKDEASTSQCFL